MKRLAIVVAALALCFAPAIRADAALTFTVEAGGWPNAAHRNAAVAAIQSTVDRYNAFSPSGFDNRNVYVYYNSGIPTAQANYHGSIGFGGTYPAERVMMHEMAHYLGLPSGNWGQLYSGGSWSGARGRELVQQFEGEQATLNGDSVHFWPYGLNFDSEGSEINKQRQVAMVYAMRADLGIGPSDHPSGARSVTMIASDPAGESSFNRMTRWSDGYFPHSRPGYFTSDFALRTPTGPNSYEFAGNFLSVDNTNGEAGGLIYQGMGSSAVITMDKLYLDGGWIQHMAGDNDVFQFEGNLNVQSDSHLRAKQGNIHIRADITGEGDLTIHPGDPTRQNLRYVRFLSANNSFVGNIENQSRFELAELANHTFVIGGPGENNAITGESALATALNGMFEFDLSGASTGAGDSWSLVTANNTTYGATFNVAGFTNDGGIWSDGSYAFDPSTGLLAVIGDMAALAGDYNDDGIVSAADYVVWRNHEGTEFELPNRDPNAGGNIGAGDYQFWAERFGNSAGSGASASGLPLLLSASANIPEPSAVGSAVTMMLLLAGSLQRHCIVRR
jgi:hypothetical protein